MSIFKSILTEALNPLNKIANSIIKKLNYIESSMILDTKSVDECKKTLNKLATFHSNAYDELSDEQKQIVLQKIWNTIHTVLTNNVTVEESDSSTLENKIYTFLKLNGGILYPLEKSAKDMAKFINAKDKED